MNFESEIKPIIKDHQLSIKKLYESTSSDISTISNAILHCIKKGGKVLWMGNGGSAADSQHLAAEFVGRFQLERKGLPSVALTTNTSILTAVSNDYGYEAVFERQVETLCREGDVVIGISTSGNSANVLSALGKANALEGITVGFTGEKKAAIDEIAQHCLKVPSSKTARIQEMHILCGHIICEIVENAMFKD